MSTREDLIILYSRSHTPYDDLLVLTLFSYDLDSIIALTRTGYKGKECRDEYEYLGHMIPYYDKISKVKLKSEENTYNETNEEYHPHHRQ
jgi:hypothetical protein